MNNVQTAFTVSELHDMAEDIDHQIGAFFLFVYLIGNKTNQLFLISVKHNGVNNAAAHGKRVKRTFYVVGNSVIISAFDISRRAFDGDHYNGDIIDPALFVHDLQNFKTVHFGHDHIKHYKRNLKMSFFQYSHSFHAVFSLNDLIVVLKDIRQHTAVHFGIVNDQNFLFAVICRKIFSTHFELSFSKNCESLLYKNTLC